MSCLSSVGAGAAVIAGRCWHLPDPFNRTSPRTWGSPEHLVLDVAMRVSVQDEGSTARAFVCLFAAVYTDCVTYTSVCCNYIYFKCRAFVNLHVRVIRWETMCNKIPGNLIQQGRCARASNQPQLNTAFLISNICNQSKVCKSVCWLF